MICSRITHLIMDVDGTLTDGKIYMGTNGELMKAFSVKDGLRIAQLANYGIDPIILTGRVSEITQKRCTELGIQHIYQGIKDKRSWLQSFCVEHHIEGSTIAYIGDDENDIPGMRLCGLIGCPNDAVDVVKEISHYVCQKDGGDGAVREFIDYLLSQAGTIPILQYKGQ